MRDQIAVLHLGSIFLYFWLIAKLIVTLRQFLARARVIVPQKRTFFGKLQYNSRIRTNLLICRHGKQATGRVRARLMVHSPNKAIGSLTACTLYTIISIILVSEGPHHVVHEQDPIGVASRYRVVCWPVQMVFYHLDWLLLHY